MPHTKMVANESYAENGVGHVKLYDVAGRWSGEFLVDEEDLERVIAYGRWYNKGREIESAGHRSGNGRISLNRFLLNPPKRTKAKYLDGDFLNCRKSNLFVYGGENKYIVEGEVAKIALQTHLGEVKAWAVVDSEDLEMVLERARWSEAQGYVGGTTRDGTNKKVKLHSVVMGEVTGKHIDHANQNPFDNRKCNLRFVTRSENQQNRNKPKFKSHSGVKNVYVEPSTGRYYVALVIDGKQRRFGTCGTIEEADKLASAMRKLYYTHCPENSVVESTDERRSIQKH